ncbi:MAG: polysaccharide deacetylase family protein, partial [Sphingomonas sp.]
VRRQFHLMQGGELAECRARGLEIGLHTHRHIDVASNIGRLDQEVAENRDYLAEVLGEQPSSHFCYPSGTWHRSAPALLAQNGVASATLVREGLNAPAANPYALRRFVDGRGVAQVEFDAYLSGALHYLTALRGFANGIVLEGPRKAAAASSMMLCAL